MTLTTEQIQQILDGGSNATLTRHKNLERNKTLNEATCKLSDIVNNHDPEIDVPIELGVWDCLDDYTAKIERDLYQEILTLRQRVQELEQWKAKTKAVVASAVFSEGLISDKTMSEMLQISSQHDTEVAARAVEDAANTLCTAENDYYGEDAMCYKECLIEYANQLREQGDE